MAYRSRGARKGLSEEGSTRAWRKLRKQLGPHPAGPGPWHVHHIKPRRLGGRDTLSNVRWIQTSRDPYNGRPRKNG